MSRASRNPLVPDRDGVSPSCVATVSGPWHRMLDFLSERVPYLTHEQWAERMAAGWVWGDDAQPLDPEAPFLPHTRLYYWRFQPGEQPWPNPVHIVHQDECLVVADKPHFMAVTPTGQHVQRSLLVHLKRQLGLPELTPIHRIDRDTAGLVVFAVQAQHRAAYQNLFRDRLVAKRYEAIAPWVDLDALAAGDPAINAPFQTPCEHLAGPGLGSWEPLDKMALAQGTMQDAENATSSPPCSRPWCYRSRLEEDHGFFTMHEAPGHPNSETHLQCLARLSDRSPAMACNSGAAPAQAWALYALTPHTGRRHQLRAHLSALGMPIRNDPFYPSVSRRAEDADNLTAPLQLLARAVAFSDPVTGEARHFVSRQRLGALEEEIA